MRFVFTRIIYFQIWFLHNLIFTWFLHNSFIFTWLYTVCVFSLICFSHDFFYTIWLICLSRDFLKHDLFSRECYTICFSHDSFAQFIFFTCFFFHDFFFHDFFTQLVYFLVSFTQMFFFASDFHTLSCDFYTISLFPRDFLHNLFFTQLFVSVWFLLHVFTRDFCCRYYISHSHKWKTLVWKVCHLYGHFPRVTLWRSKRQFLQSVKSM